jgi:hypothetical protein
MGQARITLLGRRHCNCDLTRSSYLIFDSAYVFFSRTRRLGVYEMRRTIGFSDNEIGALDQWMKIASAEVDQEVEPNPQLTASHL